MTGLGDGGFVLAVIIGLLLLAVAVGGTFLYNRIRRREDVHETAPAVLHEDEAELVAEYAQGRIDEEEFRMRLEQVRRERPPEDHG